MRIQTGVLGLAFSFSSMVGNAWAQEACARVHDLTALQVAAVQQELMVAALSCNDVALYNNFVIAYRADLVQSDAALQAFFLRLNAQTGSSDYHAYKTKLANTYSIRSSGNKNAYCRRAEAAFHAALGEEKKSLTAFVLAQPMLADQGYAICGESVPGGAMVAQLTAPAATPPALPATAAPKELPAKPATSTPSSAANIVSPDRTNGVEAPRNRVEPQTRVPERSAQPRARTYRYEARDPYARDSYGRAYGDDYGYTNNYGERDPYYRNPYSRYWYGATPPQYYLRRR